MHENTALSLFTRTLANAGNWLTSADLEAFTGYNERMLRALAAQSKGTVISGTKGYKLTTLATPSEVAECTGRLRSQAAQMVARASTIDAVYAEHLNPVKQLPLPLKGDPAIVSDLVVSGSKQLPGAL